MYFSNPIADPNYFQLLTFLPQPLLTNFEFDPNDFVDSNVFEQFETKESEFVNMQSRTQYEKLLYFTGLIFLIQPSDKNYIHWHLSKEAEGESEETPSEGILYYIFT